MTCATSGGAPSVPRYRTPETEELGCTWAGVALNMFVIQPLDSECWRARQLVPARRMCYKTSRSAQAPGMAVECSRGIWPPHVLPSCLGIRKHNGFRSEEH